MQGKPISSPVKELSCHLRRFNNTCWRETRAHLALLMMKWLLDGSHLLQSTLLRRLQTPGVRQTEFTQMANRGTKRAKTAARIWKQGCSNSQAATMINLRCKSMQRLGWIVSKNSCKRLVDLLKAGEGKTRCRDLKKKFNINTWMDSNLKRVIQLQLAG